MKTEYEDQILAAIAAVKDRFAQGRVKNVYFVACGGSKATMMPAQYMLDREIETPAAIYTSNEFNYGTPKAFGKDSIVFTISHSGTTPETVRAAQTATDAGAVSICFTNEANSPLWNAAQYPIQYEHGKDVADENKGGQIQLRCWFELLKVLDSAHEAKWQAAIDAMSQLTELKEKAMAQFKNVCTTYASATKRAPLIYTMGSGINYGEVYSTACCWLMEMQWVHSSPIHSGEFFHGPFEITDYDVPFIIVVSNGTTRHLDERALAFAKKFSDQLLVIDEKEFDFGTVPADVQEYYAYQILGSVIRVFVEAHAHDTGHDLGVRRYMWQMEY